MSAAHSGAVTDKALPPIGIFDSGVGGLTVLAALLRRMPGERYRYLGDTARLPYGTKSTGTITRYALQATAKLVERRIKLLVVACNTATAAALPDLQKAYPHIPVIGVVEPGAGAACAAIKANPGGIIVLATESTIRNQAYTKAIQAIEPEADITGIPCSLFVSLAEEGWMDGPIAEGIARRYLEPVLEKAGREGRAPSCIVLGCTHFPPLAGAVAAVAGPGVTLVDSAATTAEAVEAKLEELGLLRPDAKADGCRLNGSGAPVPGKSGCAGNLQFLTTDAPERFARVGSLFLEHPIDPAGLELVTL